MGNDPPINSRGGSFETELFQILSKESPNITLALNGSAVLFVNRRCEEALGYSAKRIYSPETVFNRILPDKPAEEIKRICAGAFPSDKPFTYECSLTTSFNRKIPVILNVLPLKYKNETIALCEATEITKQKTIESILCDSMRQYSSALDSLDDALHVVDRDMRIILLNDGFRMLNRKYDIVKDVTGKTIKSAFPFLSDRVIREYEWVFRTGKPLVTEETTRIGGVDIFTETRKIPIVERGQVTKVVTVVRDMSKTKAIEKELKELNDKLMESNIKLRQLAFTDSHTGLYNHHFLMDALETEFARARRTGRPLSLMMIDLDNFKSVNDVYGHQFGDLVLTQFAKAIKGSAREHDMVMRYGGEEFAIIYQETDRLSTLAMGQRLLNDISKIGFGSGKNHIKLTFSASVVSYPEDKVGNARELLGLVDQLLNKAKEFGGNRVYSALDIRKMADIGFSSGGPADIMEKMARLNKRMNQGLMEAIFAFAKAASLKDNYPDELLEQVTYLAVKISEKMGVSKEKIGFIKQAVLLHDLGKVGINEMLLAKTDKLSQKELFLVREHPVVGADIIRPIQFLHNVIPSVLYHHEHWDGNGYPIGLKGDEIPVEAQIVALLDSYQALISDRPYRKAFIKEEAVKIIKQDSGKKFNPFVVKTFLQVV